MKINAYCYFALLAVSGAFAVTFSVVFAYVADVTEEADRRSLATTFAILLNIFDLPREQSGKIPPPLLFLVLYGTVVCSGAVQKCE